MTPTDRPASSRPQTAGVATDGLELCGSYVFARGRRRARRALLALPTTVAMLALAASPALAQSTSGYSEKPPVKTTTTPTTPKSGTGPSKEATTPKTTPAPKSNVEPSTAASTPTTTPTTTTPAKSTLPFTGLDLRWVLGVGLLLLAGGLSLRFATRRGGVRS
jgi:uncharacterized membrane protein